MTMTVEDLQTIETEASTATAEMVDHHIRRVRSVLTDAPPDTAAYASALLLKLQHLADSQRARVIDPRQPPDYLAPGLSIEPPPFRRAA